MALELLVLERQTQERQKNMKNRLPLIDEHGEVRELSATRLHIDPSVKVITPDASLRDDRIRKLPQSINLPCMLLQLGS